MSITPWKWGWGEAGEAIAFWGFIGGGATPITPTVIGGGYVPSRRKSREKREENEIMLFIKEFLRVQGL